MFVVDTNVLLYAANEDSPLHERCATLLERWRGGGEAWFLTWGICYEFTRVVSHARMLERPWGAIDAWRFIESLLASPAATMLVETDRHATVGRTVIDEIPSMAGNLVHDGHTAILMREHGIRRIVTRDSDFHRFAGIEPIDPLA